MPDGREVGAVVASPAWRLVISAARLRGLRGDRDVQSWLVLARIANALRSARRDMAVPPALAGTPAGDRQALAAVLHAGALLFEGIARLEKVGRYLVDLPEQSSAIQALLDDEDLTRLHASVLKRLRNKVAFHFDEAAVRDGLRALGDDDSVAFWGTGDSTVVFAAGHTECEGDVAYVLADDIVVRYLLGETEPGSFAGGLSDLCSQVLTQATRFLRVTDDTLLAAAGSRGFTVQREP